MSLIGKQPVIIPESTEVSVKDAIVTVKGSKGEVNIDIPLGITVKVDGGEVIVNRKTDKKKHKSLHGLVRSLIQNAVEGVNKPWEKHMEVVGTGYKVKMQGQDLVFDVGLSHSVPFKKVEGITFAVKGNKLTISGIDKQYVGEIANKIKTIKKPDAYKGKGIRYQGELLRLKPGKKAKTA